MDHNMTMTNPFVAACEERRQNEPVSVSEVLHNSGFVFAMCAILFLGVVGVFLAIGGAQ